MKGVQDFSQEGVNLALRELWQQVRALQTDTKTATTQLQQLHKTLGFGAGGRQVLSMDNLAAAIEHHRQEAAAAAADAAALANQALAAIITIANDNIISAIEKQTVIDTVADILDGQAALVLQATIYGIKAEKTAYTLAITNLTTFLAGLTPAWDDVNVDTPLGTTGGLFLTRYLSEVSRTRDALRMRIETGIAVASTATIDRLAMSFGPSSLILRWDPVDILGITYEVRVGPGFDTGQIVGRPVNALFDVSSDGTYWVASRFGDTYGVPSSIIVTGAANLQRNVLATCDEKATAWPGTRGTGIIVNGEGSLTLNAGLAASGRYESTNVVDIGRAQLCGVYVSQALAAGSLTDTIDTWPSIDARTSFDGKYGSYCRVEIEIALAQDDGVFGPWLPYVPGNYLFRKCKLSIVLTSLDASSIPYVMEFASVVDVPDRTDSASGIACPSGGLTITYAKTFQITPATNISISGAARGDYYVLTGETSSGFTVRCYDSTGTAVARTISRFSKGY